MVNELIVWIIRICNFAINTQIMLVVLCVLPCKINFLYSKFISKLRIHLFSQKLPF